MDKYNEVEMWTLLCAARYAARCPRCECTSAGVHPPTGSLVIDNLHQAAAKAASDSKVIRVECLGCKFESTMTI